MDAEGFTKPSLLGFPDFGGDIDDNLKMRLFPIFEMKKAYEADEMTATVMENIFGVANTAWLMGDNFQQMPGSIWSVCLGSPIRIPADATLASNSNYKGWTIAEWTNHYLGGQFAATACHLYFSRTANNWGGLCLYLDVTEGSLLSRTFDVRRVLDLLLAKRPNFSLLESDANIDAITQKITEALTWLKNKIPVGTTTSMGMILVAGLYAIFRRFKHEGADWHVAPAGAAAAEYHNYNLRIYLIKRRGRFVYDPYERGYGLIPTVEMPAKREELDADGNQLRADEKNLSERMWLAMAQYYRLMSCWMRPVDIKITINNKIKTIPLKTLRRFITRDAHATTTSSISAAYDAIFFNEAAAKGGRAMLLGIDGWYKKNHHAKFYTEEDTWVGGIPEGLTNSFGILAGVCWYFNPNMNEQYCSYPIFRLPFDILRDKLDAAGVASKVPTLLHEKDEENFIDSKAFFNYGVDEYILSEFVAQQFHEPARWNEINLLFFTIHWIYHYLYDKDISKWEYAPVIMSLLEDELAKYTGSIYNRLPSFLETNMLPYKNIFFETFFGNDLGIDEQTIYIHHCQGQFTVSNASLGSRLQLLNYYYPNIIGAYATRNSYDRDCLMQYLHRYDRPFYWKWDGGNKIMSPRENGANIIVPNNIFTDQTNLRFVLQNQIDRNCGIGLCATDDITLPTSGRCPMMGGGRRQRPTTKKHKQKHKQKQKQKHKQKKTRKQKL